MFSYAVYAGKTKLSLEITAFLKLLFLLLLEHFLWIFVSNPISVDFDVHQSSEHRWLLCCSLKVCVSKFVKVIFFFHVEVVSVHNILITQPVFFNLYKSKQSHLLETQRLALLQKTSCLVLVDVFTLEKIWTRLQLVFCLKSNALFLFSHHGA